MSITKRKDIMKRKDIIKESLKCISDRPKEYILNLLAEECAELVQASLKLPRAWKGYTPKSVQECEDNLVEEMVDVTICLMLTSEKYNVSSDMFEKMLDFKLNRFYNRVKTGDYSK